MEILLIGIILVYVLQRNSKVDTAKFIRDNGNWLRKFKESDYDFLVRSKYGDNVDPNILFDKRIQKWQYKLFLRTKIAYGFRDS